ncbi:MAG TPA: penicillin-binding protein 2 [Candidatus Baltobacteraceae bacterium]|nr:penicillin-binding protein 2 [Candidatus Baltobacteraceae bacterium]
MHKRTFSRVGPRRAKLLFYVLIFVSSYLTWRLADVQLIHGPVYAKEALEQRSDTVEVFARRGSILDRQGNVLVRSLPSESVYAVPHDLADPDKTIEELQPIVGKIDKATAELMRDRHLQFVWIARKIPHDEADRVQALNLTGIALIEEDTGRRVDVAGQSASTILGFVGIDENGLDGLEYTFDNLLKGTSGRVTIEADEFGRPIPFGHERIIRPARPGLSLELTLDSYLQYVTETALEKQVKTYHGSSGTAIVMDPYSGEVLAMANFPRFDPNTFWKYPSDDYRDRAVQDAYEPGSTFKLVTAAAALEYGHVSLTERFPSAGPLDVGGSRIYNAVDGLTPDPNGDTLTTIIADSLNVGAAEVAMHFGGSKFYRMEQAAGFGVPTQIGISGENPGIVPPPADWSGSSLATMAFGQGVSVTPIAMARFYCAIANGGLLLRPRIVRAILNPAGDPIYTYPTEVEHRVFSQETAAQLRAMLRAVVVRGTGNPAAQIPGYTTAGKTGTAEIAQNGVYEPGAYVASFIGMVPYEHPRYVIYVKVEHPTSAIYGSVVAAPAFDEIAKAAMLHAGIFPNDASVAGDPERFNGHSAIAARPQSAKPTGSPIPKQRLVRLPPAENQ